MGAALCGVLIVGTLVFPAMSARGSFCKGDARAQKVWRRAGGQRGGGKSRCVKQWLLAACGQIQFSCPLKPTEKSSGRCRRCRRVAVACAVRAELVMMLMLDESQSSRRRVESLSHFVSVPASRSRSRNCTLASASTLSLATNIREKNERYTTRYDTRAGYSTGVAG